MSIQAKVTPIDQSISSAAAVEVPENGILKLSQSSNIALDVAPESVAGYSKSGSDLIVQLKTGESVRIANFYAEGQPSSQLFLADKDKLVAVDLPPVAADGPLMAGYIPQESLAGFESLTGAGVLGGMSAGTALLVGAAAIGAGVAISNSSGGGGGGSSVPPDTTPPKAASGLKIAPDGSSISGQAEAGASVGIDTNGDGKPDLTVIADANGNFTAPLNPPLTNGETVTVIVTDPAGNSSTPVTAEAPDFPDAPQVNASNGSVLSGTAEAGVTIVITDGNGNPIGQTSADANGNWSFTPGSQLPDGTVVNVVARDAAGNSSPATSITVDGVAPSAPVVEPSNGSELSGTAEPGSSVTLTDGNGNPIGQTTADANGNWSFTPSTPLPDGTVVNVVARDAAGNSSPPASVTVDAVAPATPVVNPSNGTTLSGTAEPGATVTLTDGNGNPIGQVTADGSGNWSFTPGTPLANGTVVNATASDPTGNTSAPASTTVDSVAPAAPVVNPSNGAEISGTAEPGATVTLTDGSGNPIGQVTADGSGNWSFTPSTPLADGTVVNATATDPAGNTGGQGSTTVDAIAPATPTVNLSNGSSLSGTAEPGSTVILTDGNGNPIAEVTADGSGNWTYTPSTPIANGTVVNVVAEDAAGNSSPPATVTVDSSAPPAPVINPSNGVVI
ncbi:Ig-like domain-containing protein, partial [Pseudomonas aeruginosa]|nr:Ig-like domain-containing protein [Pseudomonas aeruginosa]